MKCKKLLLNSVSYYYYIHSLKSVDFILVIWHLALENSIILYCISSNVKKNGIANLPWTFKFPFPKRDCF